MFKFTEILEQRWLAVLLFGYEIWLTLIARWGVAAFKALALGSKSLSPAAPYLSCIAPITPR